MADPVSPEVVAWLGAFAARLGVAAPSAEEVDVLLGLAAVAARGSARQAAPVACWLAARAGVAPDEARTIAESLSADA